MELITFALTWLEQHLLWAVFIVFAAVNVLVLAVLVAYVKLYGQMPAGNFRDQLHRIVYSIDAECDHLENPAKRSLAIIQLQQVLSWKKIFLPAAVIGFIIDAEVAVIRKMQAAAGIPDLHQEEGTNNGQNMS